MDLLFFTLDFQEWSRATFIGLLQIAGEALAITHIPSVLLRRTNRPMAQLAWILCLILLPFVGVMLWWLLGRTHLNRQRRRRDRAIAVVSDRLATLEVPGQSSDPAQLSPGGHTLLVSDNEIFPTTGCNRVGVLVSGTQAYPAFEEAIRAAKHHIHLAFYIWNRDKVGRHLRDLLAEKAREGVEVRLLYDAWGASALSFGGFMDPIREAGGRVEPFLPLRLERSLRINFRNHRKIIICDGAIGFTGGLNVGDEYNDWYDVAVRVEGPVVNQLQEVFAEDWYFAAKEDLVAPEYFRGVPVEGDLPGHEDVLARVIASGPDSRRSLTHAMFFLAITNAQDRVWITTPYFIPDQAITTALRTAAMRGVDVRLLLPGKSDVLMAQAAGRGYFHELLEAGVKIWEYRPQVLHAKLLTVDDRRSIVGSANMDTRSFHLQFELNLAVDSVAMSEQLAQQFLERLDDADEIVLEAWTKRAVHLRLLDAVARLFSPVL